MPARSQRPAMKSARWYVDERLLSLSLALSLISAVGNLLTPLAAQVMNADVYEEGDFLTSTFGFALGSDLDRSKLLTELKVSIRAYVRASI